MFIRFQNSCTYSIFSDFFEIRSDVFGEVFRFRGLNSEYSRYLLESLQQGVSEEIWENFISRKNTENFLNFLLEKKFLVKRNKVADQNLQNTLYDRQIRFLDSFETNQENGLLFNNNLQHRKIVIVGLGGYGSWLALHCARIGIKQIVGVDFDRVEMSNLPRQVLYNKKHIGLSKVTACAELLTSVDPSIKFESHHLKINHEDDLVPLLEDADLVFNAFGYYPEVVAKKTISGFIAKASIKMEIPMLCLSMSWVGPFYFPGKSACYFCVLKNPQIEKILKKTHRNPRVDKRAFASIISLSCSLAIVEASQYLAGIKEPETLNGIFSIDPFQINQSKFFPIPKINHCPYCSCQTH